MLPTFDSYATNFRFIDNLGMVVLTHSITHNVFVSVVSAKKICLQKQATLHESGHISYLYLFQTWERKCNCTVCPIHK